MSFLNKKRFKNSKTYKFYTKYLRFRSSIFSRVIYIITILSIFLFLSFGLIFKSVYEQYMNTTIRQNGNNIGSMVEGALYHSMLTNDKSALHSTLDIIHTLPGIDEVNMYDKYDNLVYSSLLFDTMMQSNPDCKSCHGNISMLFPGGEKTYTIIDEANACSMTFDGNGHRQLLIWSQINNERSCYTADCHAHTTAEKTLGSLIIKIPLQDMDIAVATSSKHFFILATITTILLVAFLILFTRKKIKIPLKAIISASEAVAKGDKSTRLEIKPDLLDDMRLVTVAFNNMLDNLNMANKELENWSHQLEYKVQKKSEELSEIQSELIHVEKIASLGKLSSSVAHEINNPLSGVLTYTKLVHKRLSKLDIETDAKESILKYLTIIENETKRCGDIVKGLLDFSRKDQKNFQNKSLHKILNDTFNLLSHQMKMTDIDFYTDFSATSDMIHCSENQIKQACVAILVNASEAIVEKGEILMRTENSGDGFIKLEIFDDGVGIAAADIPHIFEPFFSAKQKASGIGLGLAIVHGIIQNHKGKIEIDSELGKGTTFTIILPLVKHKD